MKRLAVLAALLLLASLAYGQPGKGYRDDRGYSGRGYVTGYISGDSFQDVDLETLGQDLIAGEYWTPVVDFSAGTKYYFDPAAAVSGDGSLESPFRGLGWEVFDDRVIERYRYDGDALQNSGSVVGAGDVCVLLGGDHGKIDFNTQYFTDYIGIVGQVGQTATFDYISVKRGQYYYFENMASNQNYRMGGFWDSPGDTTVAGYNTGPYFVVATRDTNGNGVASHLVFNNITLSTAAKNEAEAWSDAEWRYNAVGGIYTERADHTFFQDIKGTVLAYGVKIGGTSSVPGQYATMINSTFSHLIGDGFVFDDNEYGQLEGSSFSDFFVVDDNHVDLYQASSITSNLLIEGNLFVAKTDQSRVIPGIFSGMNISSLNTHTDDTYTNNIVYVSKVGGISINGGTRCKIINNTIINEDIGGTAGVAWARFDATGTTVDCEIFNNICGNYTPSQSGLVSENNSAYDRDFSTAGFVSWSVDQDFGTYDLHLTSSSENVDAGYNTLIYHDYTGIDRPQGLNIDIGAYEYDQGDGPFGDPVWVAVTTNTDYEDSLKVHGGRFDYVYGYGGVDSLTAKVTGWDASIPTFYGHTAFNTSIIADGSSWGLDDSGRAALTYMNMDLITDSEFADSAVDFASFNQITISDFTLGASDTLCIHGITAADLQGWWVSNNATSFQYVNRFTSKAWPMRNGGTTQGDYGRWHDFQQYGDFLDPSVHSDETILSGTKVWFGVREYLQWLALNDPYSFNIRHFYKTEGTGPASKTLRGARTSTSTLAPALIIKYRPLVSN